MVAMYADLVELGLRALTAEDAAEFNCPTVPAFLRARVKAEVDLRGKVYG